MLQVAFILSVRLDGDLTKQAARVARPSSVDGARDGSEVATGRTIRVSAREW
jgi:hypothetical protein